MSSTTYFVPGIVALALAVVSATFVNLAIGLTQQRENGLLKRVRGTPLPPWVFIAGRVVTAVTVGLAMAVVLVTIGRLVYGVSVPGTTMAGFLLTLMVGSATFSAIGIAITRVIPTETAAPAVANAVSLPLFFISGIFVPAENIPGWLLAVADVFPLKPFADALFVAFDPATSGVGLSPGGLAVVALWGLVAAGVAARTFGWVPRRN